MSEEKKNITDRHAHNCSYHTPSCEETRDLHEEVRAMARDAGDRVVASTPPSREQSLALTKIEEAMFWANAAIARNYYTGT